jgi:hypothetical protein
MKGVGRAAVEGAEGTVDTIGRASVTLNRSKSPGPYRAFDKSDAGALKAEVTFYATNLWDIRNVTGDALDIAAEMGDDQALEHLGGTAFNTLGTIEGLRALSVGGVRALRGARGAAYPRGINLVEPNVSSASVAEWRAWRRWAASQSPSRGPMIAPDQPPSGGPLIVTEAGPVTPQKTPFLQSRVSRRMLEYRKQREATGAPVGEGRNVAAYEWKNPETGELESTAAASQGRHAERIALKQVPEHIRRLPQSETDLKGASELGPCGWDYHNCRAWLEREAPGVPMEYHHEYPAAADGSAAARDAARAGRQAGNAAKKAEVRKALREGEGE